jgi:hypothetical protein
MKLIPQLKKKNLELVKEYKSNKKKPISTPIYLIK